MRLGLSFQTADPTVLEPPHAPAEPLARRARTAAADADAPPLGGVALAARNDTIDAARAVAFAAVALCHAIHSQALYPLRLIGTFSVPFYIFLALFFHARSFRRDPHRSVLRYVLARARRLYVPFLAWGAIYYLLNAAAAAASHAATPAPTLGPWFLWTGAAYHLWFLPFLLACLLVASVVAGPCARHAWVRRAVAVAGLVAGLYAMSLPRPEWLRYADEQGYFFALAWRSLPTACLALAVAWGAPEIRQRVGPRTLTALRALCRAGIVLTVTMLALQIHSGPSRPARAMSGLGWAAFALVGTHGPWVPRLAALGRLGFGAYLSHVLFLSAVRRTLEAAGFHPSATGDLLAFAAAVAGGLGLAWLLSKSKATAWLNG